MWDTKPATLLCLLSPFSWAVMSCSLKAYSYQLTNTYCTINALFTSVAVLLLLAKTLPLVYKVLYSLICSCLSMWSSRARRTAMTLCLLSSSSISPSTCGWDSSSHLRHAKSTLRLSTMPASLHWPCTALSWPASLWSPSASCSPSSPRPATGCWQEASSLP